MTLLDLRTKFVFALVAVSLGGMLALGFVAYTSAESLLRNRTLRQLEAITEAKEKDLESVVAGWKDRVSLIASRTQLRQSTRRVTSSDDAAERVRIRRIIDDAMGASASVREITVYDADGAPLVWTREGEEPAPLADADLGRVGEGIIYDGITFANGGSTVRFLAPMLLDGRRVGVLGASVDTRDLLDFSTDTTGLGSTGEAMIVLHDSAGRLRVLNPVRQRTDTLAGRFELGRENDPVHLALGGEERTLAEGVVDYRGEPVWAATRFLPELGWGLVVKFDAAEELEPARQLRDWLVGAGVALSAFAILVGTLLGLAFARPIHELAAVANRIRMGELDARAEVRGEDELGVLAATFNEMSGELQSRLTLLEEYRRLFDLSPDLLCIAGTDGYFKRVNPAFERVLGWPRKDFVERPIVDFVHPDDVEATAAEIERLAQGIPTVSFENRYRRPDGSWIRLRWVCHPDTETGLLYAVARPASETA